MTTTPVRDVTQPLGAIAADQNGGRSSEPFVVRVVLGVAVLYALVVGALALVRYQAFASDFDHGIFTQYTWLLGL